MATKWEIEKDGEIEAFGKVSVPETMFRDDEPISLYIRDFTNSLVDYLDDLRSYTDNHGILFQGDKNKLSNRTDQLIYKSILLRIISHPDKNNAFLIHNPSSHLELNIKLRSNKWEVSGTLGKAKSIHIRKFLTWMEKKLLPLMTEFMSYTQYSVIGGKLEPLEGEELREILDRFLVGSIFLRRIIQGDH
jgi:hypothetical protein